MNTNIKKILFGNSRQKRPPALLAVTPPRTGERTLLGVENLLASIAVPEPFSLELAGDMDGVTLMARCQDDQVVRGQLAAHYPQARIREVPLEEDPIFVHVGEQAWGMALRAGGPEYVPLRTFRDDDLLDPGSDPLIALMGALSELEEGERVLSRLLLRSLGPDWSQAHQARAHRQAVPDNREPSYTYQTKPLQLDGVTMAVLGAGALAALKGYLWVQDGEFLKASLLGTGSVLGLTVAGWGWWRWKQARSRVYDPLLVREKVSRVAFDAELQVIAVLPDSTRPQRAGELLGAVAAAYRHFDHPAGARFKVSNVRPVVPLANLHPAGPGLFGKRSVLGIREAAALWHPPGAGDETPLVERSGARALLPSARGVRGGAPVGDTTAGKPRPIRFPEDLLRRHHLYVARTRMGKSTLMHHIAVHKMREKAAGRDGDAIVVVDPHADLVAGLLRQAPESLIDKVRLIDLADQQRAPGINLLDTRVFADRDRTADSVVRVARGLWEQWGPRMQSILEQTVKTLHEANEHPDTDQGSQHTILDGLKLLSDRKFRDGVLAKVSDPYLLEWWARDFGGWHHQYRADALAPVQTRLSYYASSKRARAILGQPRSTIDLRETILDGGILLVSTAQGAVGRDVSALVGASLLNLVDSVIREQESLPLHQRRGALVVVDEMQSTPGVDYESMLSELGKYGASFILATQSLAKLDDLSPTMRDTILANVGCLAVFQVAGKRRPATGVGAGQGPGVRGRHRVPAGASLLRPGHRGDRADARLLHDGQEARGRRPRRSRAHPPSGLRLHPVGPGPLLRQRRRPAEGERIPPVAGRAEPGQRRGRRRGRRHGDGMMRPAGCEAEILRALAAMPFIDRLDLAAVSGWSRGAVYEAVDRLDRGGYCDAVTHATGLFPAAERFHLTAAGLERLAAEEGVSLDDLVRLQPVSDRWRRILMERLDALASVYRLAAVLSSIAYPIRFRWYRAAPLDAAVSLPDGSTVGIVRRGHTSDRSPFANRMWKLRGGPLPGAVLVLMPDPVRLRHARRMLDGFPAPVFLAVESEAVQATPDDPVWSPQAVNNAVGLRQVLDRLAPGGELPEEPESKRASVPADLAVAGPGWSRPRLPAARNAPARREARHRPGVRLALDRPQGPGRNAGRLPPAGLPGGDSPGSPQAGGPPPGVGRAPGPHRPGAGAPGPPGPHVAEHGQGAVERRSPVPRRPLRVDQRRRRPQPPAAPQPGAHRRRPRLPGRHDDPGGLPGMGGCPVGPAPPGLPFLPPRRPDALGQPRRLRPFAQGRRNLALLPGVGAPRRAALHYVGPPGPLPALLLLPPAHRRPRRAARRPHRLRRRHRPDPLPAPGPGGDAGQWRGGPPVGLPPGGHRGNGAAGPRLAHPPRRGNGAAGPRLAHPPRMGVAPGPAAPIERGVRKNHAFTERQQEERPPEERRTDRCPARRGGSLEAARTVGPLPELARQGGRGQPRIHVDAGQRGALALRPHPPPDAEGPWRDQLQRAFQDGGKT